MQRFSIEDTQAIQGQDNRRGRSKEELGAKKLALLRAKRGKEVLAICMHAFEY